MLSSSGNVASHTADADVFDRLPHIFGFVSAEVFFQSVLVSWTELSLFSTHLDFRVGDWFYYLSDHHIINTFADVCQWLCILYQSVHSKQYTPRFHWKRCKICFVLILVLEKYIKKIQFHCCIISCTTDIKICKGIMLSLQAYNVIIQYICNILH